MDGDATVLSQIMRQLHYHFSTIPFLIIGKAMSQEDMCISLEKMAECFHEHLQTVLVITNLFYAEAPGCLPEPRPCRPSATDGKSLWRARLGL